MSDSLSCERAFSADFVQEMALRACLALDEAQRCEVLNCFCSLCGKPPALSDLADILKMGKDLEETCTCEARATERIRLHRAVRMLARQAKEMIEDYHCNGAVAVWKKEELVAFVSQAVDVMEALVELAK